MKQYFFTLFIVCLLTASAFAADPSTIADPEKFSEEILSDLAQNRISDVAKKISDVAGMSEQRPALESGLKLLDGKKIEYRKKVVDKDYAGALRQIVHYTFVKDFGFVYFRSTTSKQDPAGCSRISISHPSPQSCSRLR